VPKLVKAAPDAVILIVTDPPEPLIDVTRHLVGHDRVIGTSTYLDSLRFRVHLAERFAVSPACVEANVVGEHGTSSVFLWSSARIGGMGVADALAKRGSGFDAFRREVEQDVRYANITIIEGLGAANTASAWSPRASRRSCCETSARYSRLAPLMHAMES
jgi:L-lactate dehydrogenase